MFEIMVFVLISAFYVSLAIAVIMLAFRIFLSITTEGNWKEKLMIALLPLGFGVFLFVKNDKWLKVYRIAIIVLFVFAFLASLFLFHRELGL